MEVSKMFSKAEALSNILLVYSSCESYQDEGRAKCFIDGILTADVRFKTLVARSGLFRFEFLDVLSPIQRPYIACINDGVAHSNFLSCEGETSLVDLTARLHGISNGAATILSTLIFENLHSLLSRRIVDLNFTQVSLGAWRGIEAGTLASNDGDSITFCLQDYLIRSIQTKVTEKPHRLLIYDFEKVTINAPVDLSPFEL